MEGWSQTILICRQCDSTLKTHYRIYYKTFRYTTYSTVVEYKNQPYKTVASLPICQQWILTERNWGKISFTITPNKCLGTNLMKRKTCMFKALR